MIEMSGPAVRSESRSASKERAETPVPVRVLGLCGSLRRDSLNMKLLQLAGQLMPPGMDLTVSSQLADLPLYNFDIQEAGWPAAADDLRDEMEGCDGLLVAAPEYNGTISAPLKNAIDWLSRYRDPNPLADKPCALMSASISLLGGARVQYDLRRSLGLNGALVMPRPEVFVAKAHEKFDSAGNLQDPAGIDLLRLQMAEFCTWIRRMRVAFGPE